MGVAEGIARSFAAVFAHILVVSKRAVAPCRNRASLAVSFLVLSAFPLLGDDSPSPATFRISDRGVILAAELEKQWTRDPQKLVAVLEQAVDEDPFSPPLTFLLAVAHAETNGKILIVSEAGAVGLAQATPSAYLREGGSGKLFVTREYIDGSVAYILKKPLADADTIAAHIIHFNDDRAFVEARVLLNAAFKFRREGIDELALLEPYAGRDFTDELAARDRHNLEVLQELEALIDGCASLPELITFKERVHSEYEMLKRLQRFSWKRYQSDLVAARDEVLRRAFNAEPKFVMANHAYEAAEVVASELDDRFSPISMARFLRNHIATKRDQAFELGVPENELERVTAGLYNGGSHNLLRMRTGLIQHLPETDNYMRKVPAMRARLDEALHQANR